MLTYLAVSVVTGVSRATGGIVMLKTTGDDLSGDLARTLQLADRGERLSASA